MTIAPVQFRVPQDHASFAGHFPGAPLLPGAALLDEVLRRLPCNAPGTTLEVPGVRFVSPALPGELLAIHHSTSGTASWRFEVRAGERVVMNGSVRCVARPERSA